LVGGHYPWNVHPFNYVDPGKAIEILAETSRGPVIFIRRDG